ncbi:unnamed protein product [Ectocarpus sp. 8 AP-2014]
MKTRDARSLSQLFHLSRCDFIHWVYHFPGRTGVVGPVSVFHTEQPGTRTNISFVYLEPRLADAASAHCFLGDPGRRHPR